MPFSVVLELEEEGGDLEEVVVSAARSGIDGEAEEAGGVAAW